MLELSDLSHETQESGLGSDNLSSVLRPSDPGRLETTP